MPVKTLSVDVLLTDCQNRLTISEDTVSDYAELIEASSPKWPFPDLDVFYDGKEYHVAEGNHRTLAAKRAKRGSVPCKIHQGTAVDARIFGMTANDHHGLRMTRADKRACVEWLLDHQQKLTQDEIADKSGVSKRLVKYIVAERKAKKGQIAPSGGSPQGNVSDKGKPGGVDNSSSQTTPPSSGPATDEAADSGEEGSAGTTPQESGPRPPRSGKDKQGDLGKCPNCASTKWNTGEFGEVTCAKCSHPHGEPVGDRDENQGSTADVQRAKTVKTIEALMRAFDDMNTIIPRFNDHREVIAACKVLLTKAKTWR